MTNMKCRGGRCSEASRPPADSVGARLRRKPASTVSTQQQVGPGWGNAVSITAVFLVLALF